MDSGLGVAESAVNTGREFLECLGWTTWEEWVGALLRDCISWSQASVDKHEVSYCTVLITVRVPILDAAKLPYLLTPLLLNQVREVAPAQSSTDHTTNPWT